MHLGSHLRWLLLCVVCWSCGYAAAVPDVQRQMWTTEDGLPQDSVHAMLQARDGHLWLATESGAARFDGLRFDRYSSENTPAFTSNDLCCLAEAGDGSLYFGTSAGVVRLREGHFDPVPGFSDAAEAMQRAGDGSVLVLTAERLLRLRGLRSTPEALTGGAQPSALGSDSEGHAVLTAGTTLYRESGSSWLPMRAVPAGATGVLGDGRGTVWLRTRSEIIALASRGETHWRLGRELPGTRLNALLRDGLSALASTNQGTYELQADTQEARPAANVGDIALLSSLTDREGDLWFGGDTTGLLVLRPRAVHTLPELASETVTCVMEAGGALWFGTRDSGVRVLRGGKLSTPAASAKLASQVVLSLSPDPRSGVWVGTADGLDHVQGDHVIHLNATSGLPDDLIRSVLAVPDGSVWVGTRHGLAHVRAGKVERVLTTEDGLPSDIVGTLLRTADGTLWAGTARGLVSISAADARPQPAGGTPGEPITGLAEAAEGTLWVSTRDGLGMVSHSQFSLIHLSGAPAIFGMLADGAGHLWLRTATGLAEAEEQKLSSCAGRPVCDVALRQYGTADGVSSADISFNGHPAAWRAQSGELWFASRRGVSVVNPAASPEDRVPPPVAVEQVLVDGRPVPLGRNVQVPAGSRRLQITYAGLSLRAPAQLRYRFRLEGFDKDWTDAGTRRTAEYTNLPPGTFRLLVEARNADGVASEQPAEQTLVVARPFYRTWWFYLLLLCGAALLVYAAYWLRLRFVRREFAAVLGERNRIAREIHDTLAQDFVAVSLQLEVTAQLLKRDKVLQAREQVDATRQLVQSGIRDARESIWALRAESTAQSLPAQLKAVAESASREGLQADCSVSGTYRVLSLPVEKEVLRIAKEAFGNAVKHAGASRVSISLLYSEDAIVLQVSDDGVGFNPEEGAARAGHYGLRGMRERASGLGATLALQSAPAQGTTVVLRLPSPPPV